MLATSLLELVARLWQIFYFVVSPLLLLAGLGFLIQKTLGLDMPTLTRLNFHFVIPGMIYSAVVRSELTAGNVLKVVAFTIVVMASMAIAAYAIGLLRGVPRNERAALLMTAMFYNSANYGIPLQELAHRNRLAPDGGSAASYAVSLQVFVMLVQNIASFTIGVLLAASGGPHVNLRKSLLQIAKFPPIYALLAGILSVLIKKYLTTESTVLAAALRPFWDAIEYIRMAFIAVALCTLGAQLAQVREVARDYPVSLAVFLRLLGGPAAGLLIIHLLGFEGLFAQVLLISTGTPTAVNAMLLCMQFENHPEFVAKSVLYSMLLSPVTMTLVVFFAQGGFITRLS